MYTGEIIGHYRCNMGL